MARYPVPMPTGTYPRKRLFPAGPHAGAARHLGLRHPPAAPLISSYLEAQKASLPVVSAGGGDADAATFSISLDRRLKRPPPEAEIPPLLTPEYLQGIPAFTLRYFRVFMIGFENTGIVVFDNYQDVPAGAPLHEIILNGAVASPRWQ